MWILCIAVSVVCSCTVLCSAVRVERVQEQIMVSLSTQAQCIRLLNATHQIGCQSERDGNTGIVHFVYTLQDLQWIRRKENLHVHFVAVVEFDTFRDSDIVEVLRHDENVVGLIVTHDRQNSDEEKEYNPIVGYSPDYKCPNPNTGLYKGACSHSWNPPGTEYLFKDWNKPVFIMINSTEVDVLKKSCFEQFNARSNGGGADSHYPQCAANLKMFANAAANSATCLRRENLFAGITTLRPPNLCDPLGDKNVHVVTPPLGTHENDTGKVLLLLARMDGLSMFSPWTPAKESTISGLVGILALAEALGRLQFKLTTGERRRVMISLLHGETLDYIGSSIMVHHIVENAFSLNGGNAKLNLSDIDFVIEIGQIALARENAYFAHVDTKATDKIKAVQQSIGKEYTRGAFKIAEYSSSGVTPQLPPSSFQTFLKKDRSMPGFVVTDFGVDNANSFRTNNYNSILDRREQFTGIESTVKQNIIGITNAILKGHLVKWLQSENSPDISAAVVDELYECLLIGSDSLAGGCRLLDRIWSSYHEPYAVTEGTYIGPVGLVSRVRFVAQTLLQWYTGNVLPSVRNVTACDGLGQNNHTWMVDLVSPSSNESLWVCVENNVFLTDALSPAFLTDDYAKLVNSTDSTWVESQWNNPKLTLFLVPPPLFGPLVFVAGLVVATGSAVVTFTLHRYSDSIFEYPQ